MPIMLKRRIVFFGGSFRLAIPREVMEAADWRTGDWIEFAVDNHRVVLDKTKKR